jgi:hypothetical protein
MAPTCFGLFGPSSGSIRRNLAKVSLCRIISKNTSLKLLLCCGNMCFSQYSSVCTGCCAEHSTHFRRMLPDDGPNGPKHVGAI